MDRAAASRKNGKKGGRPPEFPPCSLRLNNKKLRHRFYKGVCHCGIVKAPALYRFEEQPDGSLVWYQKSGKEWSLLVSK